MELRGGLHGEVRGGSKEVRGGSVEASMDFRGGLHGGSWSSTEASMECPII